MNSIPAIPVITASSFDGRVLRCELPVLVLFYADGDGTSRPLLSWLGEWTPQAGNLPNIVRVVATEARAVAERFGIPSIPSLALFHGGAVCYQFCGCFSRRELDDVLTRAALLGLSRPLVPPSESGAEAGRGDQEP